MLTYKGNAIHKFIDWFKIQSSNNPLTKRSWYISTQKNGENQRLISKFGSESVEQSKRMTNSSPIIKSERVTNHQSLWSRFLSEVEGPGKVSQDLWRVICSLTSSQSNFPPLCPSSLSRPSVPLLKMFTFCHNFKHSSD